MPDDPSAPIPTPTNYQRTTGGHLRWQPPSAEHLQEMLPAYEIMSILGQGGMGAVYKGRQKSLDRIVAIKILPPEAAEDDMQFVERFKNEARTMAKMNHPAIVHVYDFGETSDGQLYIVMEFIDGTDVAKMISSKGKLPEDYSLSITAHVCDALQYAHTHGVVHRDIKPANILINMEGQVKVADFGLAKATDASQMGLTKTNMAMGTPDFVSPEALSPGTVVDGRADLYAVGVMLYNMLTGKVPRGAFRMPSSTQDTDARFDKIIGKAMEMDRENRYQTALDLRRDLDVILTAPMVKSGGQAQAAVPQQSLPQKPMGKSPGAPQPRKEAAPAAKPASKPAATPAPAKKSNAGMIYGIAAAVVVVAVAAFMFAGGGKKAVTATKPAEPAKTQPQPAPSKATSKPAPKPVASVPVATAPVVKADEKWVDGLAQWFGGTKTNEGFIRKPGQAVRIAKFASMMPLPASAPLMRDMAVRATVRLGDGQETSELKLSARAVSTTGNASSYSVIIKQEERRVRLGCNLPGKPSQAFVDYKLPADFDFTAPHTLELRTVGDLLTVTLDGKKLGDRRDTQVTAGHPALAGTKAWIESFEYANLDAGAAAPAVATAAQSDEVLTFGGHRYQLLKETLGWNSAKAQAEAKGGHLATITSKDEANFVSEKFLPQVLGLTQNVGMCRLLLGGMQTNPSSAWQWVTGERFDMSMWVGMQSDPKGDEPHYLNWDYGTKRWDHSSVRAEYYPLIEWDGEDATKPAPVAAAAYKLGDVFSFAGHRYQLVQEKLTWDAAKVKADSMGGHLATIMNKEEYDVIWDKVASKLKNRCFIGGLQRNAPDGPWEWVTGAPMALQPWMGDFPNDGKPGTRVACIFDKKGLDDVTLSYRPCDFLVEWDDDGTKKPAAPLTAPVNLLALVDVKRDAVRGEWEMKPEGLVLSKTDGPQWLSLKHTAPEEYDFEIEFTLKEGIKEVGQILPLPTGLTMWKMGLGGGDPTSFCFGPNLDGKDANKDTARTEALVRRPRLSAGQRYRSVVEVRRGSLCALIDGKEILRWTGDLKRLSNSKEFALANPAHLGLASYNTAMIFHKAELRPAVPPPATTAPPLTAPVNLLALVDVKRDAVAGDWTMPTDGLALAKGTFGVLEFPAQVPVEYDFEMEFTPTTDGNNVNQYITAGGHSFAWKLNAHARTPPLYGFELLDGKFSKETTEARTEISQALKVGTRYRSTIEVRKGSLRALLDGEELVKWSGDFSRLSMEPGTKLHDPKHIGVGAYKRGVVFHKAELRPVVPGTAAAVSSTPAPAMPAVAPAAAPTDPRLAQLEAGYQARYDSDAQRPFIAAVAALNQSYVANGIARSRAAAQAKGSLAEVTALDAEKTAIEKGSGVPAEDAADTPESLKTLRGTYRTVLAKHTAERDAKAAPLLALYLKALDVYVTELTKAGKLDEAKQVQALRDAKAAPKPAAATPAPAAAVTADDPATPKMSEREVAEWMLSMGSEISVEGRSGVKQVASLPTGKITLMTGTIYCDKTTNAELGCLAVCRDMNSLSFRNQLPENGVINLEPIRRLTKLKSLTCYPPRDSTGMEIITGLKGLTQLTLGRTEAAALDQIAALKDLESLNFAAVASLDFSALKACKKIRNLHLPGRPCIINDADVVALVATWPDLEHLTLGENNNPAPITDAAVEELVKLKKLKELKLTETKVSEAALAKLQKALPDCKVTH